MNEPELLLPKNSTLMDESPTIPVIASASFETASLSTDRPVLIESALTDLRGD